jgi:hypothetical protein
MELHATGGFTAKVQGKPRIFAENESWGDAPAVEFCGHLRKLQFARVKVNETRWRAQLHVDGGTRRKAIFRWIDDEGQVVSLRLHISAQPPITVDWRGRCLLI